MKICSTRCLVAAMLFLIVTTRSVSAQEEPLCVENSPERRGEIRCFCEHRERGSRCRVAHVDRIANRKSSRRPTRHRSENAAASGSAQIFNGGDICIYPFGVDVACPSSLRRGSVLRG